MFQYVNQLGSSEPIRTSATIYVGGNIFNGTGTGVQPSGGGSAVLTSGTLAPNYNNGLLKITVPQNIITTGNFTLEFWAYPNYSIGSGFTRRWVTWGTSNNSSYVDFRTMYSNLPTSLMLYRNDSTALDSADIVQDTTWQHIAFVRTSGSSKVYVNGNRTYAGFADTFNYASYNTVCIGGYGTGTYGYGEFHGNIDEIRLSNVARYSSNFTPPTTRFINDSNTLALIHCENALYSNSQVFEDDSY